MGLNTYLYGCSYDLLHLNCSILIRLKIIIHLYTITRTTNPIINIMIDQSIIDLNGSILYLSIVYMYPL